MTPLPVYLDILSGHLASEDYNLPRHWHEHDWQRYLDLAQNHGVLPLVQDRLLNANHTVQSPPSIRSAIEQGLKNQAILEILQTLELQRVLGAFNKNNTPVLVFKGGALAHSHYPEAKLRPRDDTDLLIGQSNREQSAEILEVLGYSAQNTISGRRIMHQCNYSYTDQQGCPHVVDLHWRLSNPTAFSELLDFESLWQRSVLIPVLGQGARCPTQVDALLIACIHRLAHHHNNHRLIWLMDIHLLLTALSKSESLEFARRAREIGVAAICTQGLKLSRDYFNTKLSPALLKILSQTEATKVSKAESHTRKYLNKDRSHWDNYIDDLRALPHWRARVAYLHETLFPDADYLLGRYNTRHRILLPILYLYRLLRGFLRLLQKR
ncbi:MAG: nucleotidyltransferase family protein [Gammaproteobacteria bacterium]|nr:nucleotidyltransferase family protein [Gammaproteobacteria bacterium]